MTPSPTSTKRADARRNIAQILNAATRCLAANPQASLAEIATAAGVSRVTLYAHFADRADLVSQVVVATIQQSDEVLSGVDLSGDPAEAMRRLLAATWSVTHRFGALVVAAVDALPADELRAAHEAPARRMRELLQRGRSGRRFRTDQPLEWQLTVIQSVIHAASAAVHRGETSADDAPTLIHQTILAGLTTTGHTVES